MNGAEFSRVKALCVGLLRWYYLQGNHRIRKSKYSIVRILGDDIVNGRMNKIFIIKMPITSVHFLSQGLYQNSTEGKIWEL